MLLLTAKPRMGKSIIIKKIINKVGSNNCIGFYSEEIKEDGERIGFQVISLSGRREVFAHVDFISDVRIGRYGIDVKIMEEVLLSELNLACSNEDDRLIVIDEIGLMQISSLKIREQLLHLAESNKTIIGTIFSDPHPWIDEYKLHKNIRLIQVTEDNRDGIVDELIEIINGNNNNKIQQ